MVATCLFTVPHICGEKLICLMKWVKRKKKKREKKKKIKENKGGKKTKIKGRRKKKSVKVCKLILSELETEADMQSIFL